MLTPSRHSLNVKQAPVLRPIKDRHDTRRRLTQFFYLLLHQYDHWRYVFTIRKLVSHELLRGNLFLRYKYIGSYMARDLSRSFRRNLILDHHAFVQSRFRALAVTNLSRSGIGLWHSASDENSVKIVLGLSKLSPMEGEWQIEYRFNGQTLSTLSFCFASSPQFCVEGDYVCLIGGFQGGYDCRNLIRLSSKSNGEISPSSMLILAIKAIASVLGLAAIYGVSSEQHVAQSYAADSMKASYDRIWTDHGASCVVEGFFRLSDAIERQYGDISHAHRRRTRKKRLRKAAIQQQIELNSRDLLLVVQ